jgi:RNA polymerase sigma factor (sigma-70 family)
MVLINQDTIKWLYRLASTIHRPLDMDLDDLVSYGMEGLLRASERYEPCRGIQFTTFAQPWIIGAIKSGIRDEWSAVNCKRRRYDEVLFSEIGEDEPDPASVDLENDLADKIDRDRLIAKVFGVVNGLPPIERRVINYIFADGRRQKTVARLMGYSPQYISQVKKRAIERIQLRLRPTISFSEKKSTR